MSSRLDDHKVEREEYGQAEAEHEPTRRSCLAACAEQSVEHSGGCRDWKAERRRELQPSEHRRGGSTPDEGAPHVRRYHRAMKVAASKPTGNHPELDERWSAILRGNGFASFRQRLGRRAFAIFPGRPRCKVCNAPYGGPAALPFRILGYRPSQRTPHVCARCLEWAPEGGVIVPLSVLSADVRGYASLTESLPSGAVSPLLNRFYDVASRVLLRHE